MWRVACVGIGGSQSANSVSFRFTLSHIAPKRNVQLVCLRCVAEESALIEGEQERRR